MLLMPRRVKYRKMQKGKSRGIAVKGSQMHFGEFGLKALENGFVPARQLEASRVVVARKLRGTGKLWINAFPSQSRSASSSDTDEHSFCPPTAPLVRSGARTIAQGQGRTGN